MTSPDDVVLFETIGQHVALITLNRPEKRHAVNGAVARRLDMLVKQTEADPAIRVVVITSSGGPTFCAGADLSEVAAGRGGDLSTPDGGFAGFVDSHRAKPWIAAVRGSALGGGLEIALACDIRVCAQSTIFGLPEVKRGIMAAAGGVYRLPRQVPRAIAMEMIATGEPIDAARALHFGLVNAAVPDDSVIGAALDYANRIAGNAPLSVRESLAIARAVQETPEAELIARTQAVVAVLMTSEDAAEGPRAFVEKRAPVWKGR